MFIFLRYAAILCYTGPIHTPGSLPSKIFVCPYRPGQRQPVKVLRQILKLY